MVDPLSKYILSFWRLGVKKSGCVYHVDLKDPPLPKLLLVYVPILVLLKEIPSLQILI